MREAQKSDLTCLGSQEEKKFRHPALGLLPLCCLSVILHVRGEELNPEAGIAQEARPSFTPARSHVHTHVHTESETPTGPSRQDTDWEKICAKYILDKELVYRMYKELLQPNNKMTNNEMIEDLKVGKILKQSRHQRRYMMTNTQKMLNIITH